MSFDNAQSRMGLARQRFKIFLQQVLNKTRSKIFGPIRYDVEGNKGFRSLPKEEAQSGIADCGDSRIYAFSFSHSPPDRIW